MDDTGRRTLAHSVLKCNFIVDAAAVAIGAASLLTTGSERYVMQIKIFVLLASVVPLVRHFSSRISVRRIRRV